MKSCHGSCGKARFPFQNLDFRAVWEPGEFNGIREVRVSPSEMWVPDMMVSNSIENFEVNRPDSTFTAVVGQYPLTSIKSPTKASFYLQGTLDWYTGPFR